MTPNPINALKKKYNTNHTKYTKIYRKSKLVDFLLLFSKKINEVSNRCFIIYQVSINPILYILYMLYILYIWYFGVILFVGKRPPQALRTPLRTPVQALYEHLYEHIYTNASRAPRVPLHASLRGKPLRTS